MPPTVASLIETLGQLGLLEDKPLAEITRNAKRFANIQALGKFLVESNCLTVFQVNKLLKGEARQLVLGPYVLLQRIGEGGMGTVYKARHRKMRRLVAVKVIRKSRLQSAGSVSRFYREVRAAAQLSHPNVVHAFDADQVGDTHILVMEYVEGVDLHRRVKEKGPLPILEACDYVRQTALGLQHARESGLVHRDIKPSNLLVAKPRPGMTGTGPTVKILDMGLARQTGEELSSFLTQEGAVVGTLDYIAPEQAEDAHDVDIRADLYSLGCTMYYLLTGKVPFPAKTPMAKLSMHRHQEPTPVEQLRPEVPGEVSAIVRKLMAKRPADRFQTPAELAAALSAVMVPCAIPLGAARPTAPVAILLPSPVEPADLDTDPGRTSVVHPPPAAASSRRWWRLWR